LRQSVAALLFRVFFAATTGSKLVMPKISKKANQKGLASLSSLLVLAQFLLKSCTLDLISFHLMLIKCSINGLA
jgi:type III secretory pathway component EscU